MDRVLSISKNIIALETAVLVFSKLNQTDFRPVSILDPLLSSIEDAIKFTITTPIQTELFDEGLDFERARSNICNLLEACSYLMTLPTNQSNPETSIATLERCEIISEFSIDMLRLLFRYSLIAMPADAKTRHDYQLLQAKFLYGKGMVHRAKEMNEIAIECMESAIVIVRQNDMDACPFVALADLLNNVAIIRMEQGKLDEARSLLEEAYDLQCTKTGPADVLLQGIVMHLARVHQLQGDYDTSEYYASVVYENISNLGECGIRRDLLKSIVDHRARELYNAAARKSVVTANESASKLLEAEKLAKEAVYLTNDDSLLDQTAAQQHLVDVMLETRRLNDFNVDGAIAKLIGLYRELVSSHQKGSVVDRSKLANALRSKASLLMRRIDNITTSSDSDRLMALCDDQMIRSMSGSTDPDTMNRLKIDLFSASVYIDNLDQLKTCFRCLLEAVVISVTVRTIATERRQGKGDQRSCSSPQYDELKEDLSFLVLIVRRFIQALILSGRVRLSSDPSAPKRCPTDWIELLLDEPQSCTEMMQRAVMVGSSRGKSTGVGGNLGVSDEVDCDGDDDDNFEDAIVGDANCVANSSGKASLSTDELLPRPDCNLIRHALTYWSVGNALKYNLDSLIAGTFIAKDANTPTAPKLSQQAAIEDAAIGIAATPVNVTTSASLYSSLHLILLLYTFLYGREALWLLCGIYY
jgi:tetratricopeptide (TPR) repeat protein